VNGARAYKLAELAQLGGEARLVADDGLVYSWSEGLVVCIDPRTGISVLITNAKKVPDWPWVRIEGE
jgi:hypothetical protein